MQQSYLHHGLNPSVHGIQELNIPKYSFFNPSGRLHHPQSSDSRAKTLGLELIAKLRSLEGMLERRFYDTIGFTTYAQDVIANAEIRRL
jgi:hypothetical protein